MNSPQSHSMVPTSQHIRNIVLDLLLTIVTCGIYNIYVQYVQMNAVNAMLGREKYSFLPWALFTILTCGLYHIYHEYRMSEDIVAVVPSASKNEPIVTLLLSLFGFHFVADAIQQGLINRYFGNDDL